MYVHPCLCMLLHTDISCYLQPMLQIYIYMHTRTHSDTVSLGGLVRRQRMCLGGWVGEDTKDVDRNRCWDGYFKDRYTVG